MMESETPPTSPPHEAGDTEVSSRRSPDLPKPEANTPVALSPERLAPTGGDEKGPSGARRALGGAPLFNEHGAHEDFIRY